MQLLIEKMLTDFERGGMTRRQLALSLAALVTSAEAAPKEENLRAVTLNHVTVRVPDIHRTSQFYQEFFGMPLKQHSANVHILGVGKSFFGIEQKGTAASLDHFDFGIAGFNADKAIEKIKELEAKYTRKEAIGQYFAAVYVGLGDKDKAFEWLEKAVANGEAVSRNIIDPMFMSLHNDPRWLPFLRKHGMAPEQLAAIKFDVKVPR